MLHEGARGETRSALSHLFPDEPAAADQAHLQLLLDDLKSLAQLSPHELPHFEDEALPLPWGQHDSQDADSLGVLHGAPTPDDVRIHLSVATAVWIQDGYRYNPGFTDAVRTITEGEVATADFNDGPSAAAAINEWAKVNTQGLCGPMVTAGLFSSLTRAVLGTAVLFKGRWEQPFRYAESGHFYQLDNARLEVRMMLGWFERPNYVKRDGFWALELPYDRRPISMVVLVPDSPGEESLVALEGRIGPGLRDVIDTDPYEGDVKLTMPRFKIQCSPKISGSLASLGLGTIFKPRTDFSGISSEPGFQVAEILHDAYIDVNPYGTQAAAATLAIYTGIARPRPEPIALTIDRPFVFAVVEKTSGAVLFAGRVVRPE